MGVVGLIVVKLSHSNGSLSTRHSGPIQPSTSIGLHHNLLVHHDALCMLLWPFPEWLWTLGHFPNSVELQWRKNHPSNFFHSHIIPIQGTSKQYYELMVLSVNKGEGGVADKRDQCSGHDLRTAANSKFLQSVIVVRHQNCKIAAQMLTSDIHVTLWSNDDKLTISGDAKAMLVIPAKTGFNPYHTKPNLITMIQYI